MRVNLFYSLVAFSMFVFPSCDIDSNSQSDNCVNGTGSTVTYSPTVDSFHSINAAMVGNVFLSQGSPQDLSIVTHQSIVDILGLNVIDGVLRIYFEKCINELQQFDAFITLPDIQQIDFAGVGELTAQNDLILEDLVINLTGVGDINLKGTAEDLNITLTGVGNILAKDMLVKTCTIVIIGNGDVEVNVSEVLMITINGVGNVRYKGDPTVFSTINGNGSVNQIE
jgi:hypothetical protein